MGGLSGLGNLTMARFEDMRTTDTLTEDAQQPERTKPTDEDHGVPGSTMRTESDLVIDPRRTAALEERRERLGDLLKVNAAEIEELPTSLHRCSSS